MHPDFSLVLQKCASNLSLKHKQPFLNKTNKNNKNMSDINPNSPEEQEDLVRIVSDEEDESREPNREHVTQEDNISMCSELSVGKENPEQDLSTSNHMEEEEEILDISDTHSNSSNDEMSTTSLGVGVQESQINPFNLANTLRFPVPFGLTTNNNNNNNATTTNISPFQEEFLRKSHLYAEELMKHQMQLMAAARASAFSLRSHTITPQLATAPHLVNHLHPLAKIGQLSAAAAAAAFSAAAQQNHKPLNHHNQYNQNMLQQQQQNLQLNHQYDTLAKLTEISKQHTLSSNHSNSSTQQMMSTLNQLQTQMQAHLPGLLHGDNNDNLHERALKFSIDNILKADFGRSNSLDSPPLQRKSSNNKSHNQRHKHNICNPNSSSASSSILTESLEHTVQSLSQNQISPTTQTFSSSLATICTNSNDSSSTAVSSNYSSANGGAGDLVKSSPSQTPTLSPGFSENGSTIGNKNSSLNSSNKSEENSTTTTATSTSATGTGSGPIVWPAWVYCTRYSDRPSSGPRVRKPKTPKSTNSSASAAAAATATNTSGEIANSPSSSSSSANNNNNNEDKRPRTAFSGSQLARLKHEFNENRYLTEKRRQQLSSELGLNEAQIKIWFQNKRAKLKKSSGVKNPLALQLMAQGLYNHSTIPLTREEEELQEMQEREKNGGTSNNNNNLQPAAGAVSS